LGESNIIPRESAQTSLWSFRTREFGQPTEEGRQMTATKIAGATSHEPIEWQALDWQAITRTVRRLQARIVQAIQARRWGKVKALQHLLTHSFSAKALAVRRVTENPGRHPPGVDQVLWNTPQKKAAAIHTLRQRGYRAQPLRRVLIPKPNGKMRPLGISTMRDRAMQALYLFALDPIAETTGDPNSYGFRPQRCTADAIEQCRLILSRRTSAQGVLEADLQACFDGISHEWLEAHIPMEKAILRQWLKAGIMTKGAWQPTDAGTPQGNIASPVLCNLTLNGLEQVLRREHLTTRQRQAGLINLVRWADDFIITGRTPEVLPQEVKSLVESFLQERGLRLAPEKTRITHIDEGFDFLGKRMRKYKGKFLAIPSKKNT
jgi:RNA-directed DNA polymerase